MTKTGLKYRCNICGNEVGVTRSAGGNLVCCGHAMVEVGQGYTCTP
jgi:desulfoferrodoxin-like iron-binding protein